MRIETRPHVGGGLVAHVLGTTRPETVRTLHDDSPAVVRLDGDVEAAMLRLAELPAGGRGRPAHRLLDCLFAGPPAYGDDDEWTYEREVAWARRVADYAHTLLGPESAVIATTLHRDETSPHVHVLAVPICEGRLGWTRVRDARCRAVSPSAEGRSSRRKYSVLQDDYYEQVSAHFGLGRGEVGSTAKHRQVDRQRAAEAAAQVADKAATTAARRMREAEAAAQAAAAEREREEAAAQVARAARERNERAAAKAAEQREAEDAKAREMAQARKLSEAVVDQLAAVAEDQAAQAKRAMVRVEEAMALERDVRQRAAQLLRHAHRRAAALRRAVDPRHTVALVTGLIQRWGDATGWTSPVWLDRILEFGQRGELRELDRMDREIRAPDERRVERFGAWLPPRDR